MIGLEEIVACWTCVQVRISGKRFGPQLAGLRGLTPEVLRSRDIYTVLFSRPIVSFYVQRPLEFQRDPVSGMNDVSAA